MIMVKNYMEILVDECLPEVLEDEEKYGEVCKCSSCIAAIKAEVLNAMPPFYVTCKTGEVYGQYSLKVQQKRADMLAEITRAVEKVRVSAHKPDPFGLPPKEKGDSES